MSRKYLTTFIDYQDKQYHPGYYTGGRLHPAVLAKTKAGGYALLVVGLISFCLFLFQTFTSYSLVNNSTLIYLAIAVFMIIVGLNFLRPPSTRK